MIRVVVLKIEGCGCEVWGATEFSAALEPGKYLTLQEEGSFSENERAVCRKGIRRTV
jgi:hypothetical protein